MVVKNLHALQTNTNYTAIKFTVALHTELTLWNEVLHVLHTDGGGGIKIKNLFNLCYTKILIS